MQQRASKSASRLLRLQFEPWKRGRAVEGTGLENRRRGNPFVSSNLTASAKFTHRRWLSRNSFSLWRLSDGATTINHALSILAKNAVVPP